MTFLHSIADLWGNPLLYKGGGQKLKNDLHEKTIIQKQVGMSLNLFVLVWLISNSEYDLLADTLK